MNMISSTTNFIENVDQVNLKRLIFKIFLNWRTVAAFVFGGIVFWFLFMSGAPNVYKVNSMIQ